MSIPALDMWLIILEALIRSQKKLHYIDLKHSVDVLTNASLNRLLISPQESGHIDKGWFGYSLG